jgi:hypothetical protein
MCLSFQMKLNIDNTHGKLVIPKFGLLVVGGMATI